MRPSISIQGAFSSTAGVIRRKASSAYGPKGSTQGIVFAKANIRCLRRAFRN
jgi:hypothetical protein